MALEMTKSPTKARRGRPAMAEVSEGIRERAFARARRHSWLVRFLKISLPVVAVVSTVALFFSPTMLVRVFAPHLNASLGAVQLTTDQLRMIHPRFDGFTADQGHYVVTAEAAVQALDNTELMHLETVHGHLVQLDKSWTDITSKAGTYQTRTKALRLTDGIVITTSATARVVLDHADADVDKKIVTSDADVTMTMPNGTLMGRGLLVDDANRRIVLNDAVKAHLLPPPRAAGTIVPTAAPTGGPSALSMTPTMSDAPVDITSKQLEILDNAKTATFTGAVRAVQAGTIVVSERMEVGYTGAAGAGLAAATSTGATAQNISYVTNTSNVVITTEDGRRATCNQSRFDQKANTMTMLGAVVLSQKGSELHADTVVYDMQAKKTHVSAKNRVTGHFEQLAAEPVAAKSAQAAPRATLAGLGASRAPTDIAADSLEIANADNEAVFHGTVIVTQRGNKLTGEQLAIDLTKHHMVMSGPGRVSGVFEASETADGSPVKSTKAGTQPEPSGPGGSLGSLAASSGQPTNVEADSLDVQDDRGEATFTGKVVVVRGGHRITAEQLTVAYAGGAASGHEGSQLKQIRAKDHVVVRTPDNELATGNWLLYDPGHNKLTIGGNVTVSQGGNVVHGEKLLVDLATGESHFETRADDSATNQSNTTTTSTPSTGRIQVLITPQGIKQISGPTVAKPQTPATAQPQEGLSASDVMVAPNAPQ